MIKKLILPILLIPLLLSLEVGPAAAQKSVFINDQVMVVEAKSVDPRALVLKDYLAKFNSPLESHSQDFIDAADTYQLDWKLVPAISGVESTFGKAIPGGFNGWGWGVYGTQAIYFKSWREAIFEVSRGLKEDYISRGLTNPYSINKRYAVSQTWGSKVSYFMGEIDKHSKKYNLGNELTLEKGQDSVNTAGSSAKLAFRFAQIGGI